MDIKTSLLAKDTINGITPMLHEQKAYVHFHGATLKGKILMVASSPTISKQTGWPIGLWAAELTHPLRIFMEAGYEVELASTEGGKIEMDAYSNPTDVSGYSANDVITLGYMQMPWFNEMLTHTKKAAEADPKDYAAVFLVGGQAPMYTFRGNTMLEKLFVSFYESGKPSAAVCHSTSLLLGAKKSSGELLVKGKSWTGFANSEEDFVDKAVGIKVQPYRIEDEARKIAGTTFKVAEPFSSYVIRDGNLITGQQQNSGAATAALVVQMLADDGTKKPSNLLEHNHHFIVFQLAILNKCDVKFIYFSKIADDKLKEVVFLRHEF